MFVVTGQISIDKERTSKYNEIFVKGGTFIGDKIKGHVYDSILQVDCDSTGYKNINIYLDLIRRSFTLKEKPLNESLTESDLIHIGGIILNCNNKKIEGFIEQEDPCLEYKRGFDESFSSDFLGIQEVINTCESLNKEFTTSFNTDYNINEQGTGIILDCRVYGSDVLVDGNIVNIDGNQPKPNCEN